ncbi:hypothetical protein [Thermus sp.]|uniref:hypothetical protein n=1 Tax=Thermus sp. TaxID=275 RepID=UPI003D111DCF
MRRLESILDRLEEALEGGEGPTLITITYERPDGPPLEPSEEAKRKAIREARKRGRTYAVAYPEVGVEEGF